MSGSRIEHNMLKRKKNEKKVPVQGKKNFTKKIRQLFVNSYTSTLIIVAASNFVLFNFILQLGCVKSGSMEPALKVGDYTVYNRLAYTVRDPERGDIIIFRKDGVYYGKRIIGIAGDEIQFADGYVYLNGTRLDESAYLDEDVETYCTKTFTVPKGCVFLLGDNRENSLDSRRWENPYVSTSDIVSKYIFTVPVLHTSKYDL